MVNAPQSSLQQGPVGCQQCQDSPGPRSIHRGSRIRDIRTCMWYRTSLSICMLTCSKPQPHSVCALMWSTACHISYMYDLDTGLNHAAEASQVDLYRPHGASSLAKISKDSAVRPYCSALFHIPSRHALSHMVQFPVSRRIHCMHRAQTRASVPAIISRRN